MAVPAFDQEIDVRGLNCPLPVLRTRSALRRMSHGQVLRVLATDRESPRDFERFARETGNELLAQTTNRKEFAFYLRKA